MRVLARDQFACIYCGRLAPIVSSPITYIQEVLRETFGPANMSPALGHNDTCSTCQQYLPGILRVIPMEALLSLEPAQRERIYQFLQSVQLQIHHPIPQKHLKKLFARPEDRKKYKAEFDLVTNRFLVTTCSACNAGLGSELRPIAELESVLRNVVHRENQALLPHDLGALRGLHFRAEMLLKRERAG